MGDHDRRPALHQRFQALHDLGLARSVETRRRLVEDEDRRIAKDRPRDRDPLSLPAREPDAALPELGVVPVGQGLDECVRPRCLGRGHDRFPIDLDAVGDVLGDRAREEDALLQDETHLIAQPLQRALADVSAVDHDPPVLRVVEAGDERRNGRLARAGAPDHRELLPRRDEQRDRLERRPLRLVAEHHAVELDLAGRTRPAIAVRRVRKHVVRDENLGHAVGAGEGLRHPARLARDIA